MKTLKKLLALVLALAMALSLVACGGSSDSSGSGESANSGGEQAAEPAGEEEGSKVGFDEIEAGEIDTERRTTNDTDERYPKVTVAVSVDPQDLNPWNVNSGSKGSIYCYIYESLFDYDAENYYPVLAKGYTISDDGLQWDVELYDYIHDSEGNPITADDVVFSYQVQIDSGYAAKFDMFESIEKVDDYTVRFTWNKVIDGVCEVEWPLCNIKIFSQKAYEEGNFASAPVATGPYVVESFTTGSSVILKVNENYWQTDASLIAQGHHQNVEEIDIVVIAEAAQQVIALQNGTIDISTIVPNENLSDFTDGEYSDQYDVVSVAGSMNYYLMGNMSGNSIWSDVNFRNAVFYALNNEMIANAGSLPPCTSFTTQKWTTFAEAWADEDDYVTNYDPELAAQYLAESAYDGSTLTLLTQSEEVFKNQAVMIQALLEQVGIHVELSVVTDTEFSATTGTGEGYDLLLSRSGGPSLIGSFNKLFNTADFDGDHSIGMLSDPKLLELYATANTAEGYNVENMTALRDYVIENAYADLIAYSTETWVYTSNIAEIGKSHVDALRVNDSVFYLD
ncbi:MAG: ABC transporter substrate-binding protein [Candidatus Onthomonas sp.]